MRILTYLTVSIFLLIAWSANSQELSIEYVLPKEAEFVLKDYLNNELSKRDTSKQYYCVLQSKENAILLSVQSYDVRSSNEFIKVIKSSNRFISIEAFKLPIIFDLDFLLVAYGSDAKGRPIRKQIIYEYPYKIEFDKTGRILSKGFK